MSRPENLLKDFIGPAVHVLISNKKGDGSARGLALEYPGEDLYLILFLPRGFQPVLPRTAPCHVTDEVLRRERNLGRAAVNHDAHTISMGLPEGGDLEYLSE